MKSRLWLEQAHTQNLMQNYHHHDLLFWDTLQLKKEASAFLCRCSAVFFLQNQMGITPSNSFKLTIYIFKSHLKIFRPIYYTLLNWWDSTYQYNQLSYNSLTENVIAYQQWLTCQNFLYLHSRHRYLLWEGTELHAWSQCQHRLF